MKKETKQGLAVVGTMLGVGGAVYAVSRVKAAPPIMCTPGEEKCRNSNWCRCNPEGTGWIVVTPDDPRCIAVTGLSLTVELEPATEVPEPGVIYAGGMMGIRGTVYNGSETYQDYNIEWYANGELIWSYPWGTQRIVVGNTHKNYYRWTVPAVGHYDIMVRIYNSFGVIEDTASFDAIEAPPGVPDIRGHKPIVMTPAGVGEYMYADMLPKNYGDGTGSYTLEWHLIDPDGIDTLVKTQSGTLAPGAYDCLYCTEPILDKLGTYTVTCVLSWDGHIDEYSAEIEVIL